MADKSVSVRENTSFDWTLQLLKFRDESQPSAIQSVAGYAFRFRVWQVSFDDDGDEVFTTLFTVTGAIVTAASGTFKFALTPDHTCLPPGTYDGEVVWWSSGTPTTDVPTDSWSVEYEVVSRRDQTAP